MNDHARRVGWSLVWSIPLSWSEGGRREAEGRHRKASLIFSFGHYLTLGKSRAEGRPSKAFLILLVIFVTRGKSR